MTTSDYSWLRVPTSQTKSDCKWLQVTTIHTTSTISDYEWLRARLRVTSRDYKWLQVTATQEGNSNDSGMVSYIAGKKLVRIITNNITNTFTFCKFIINIICTLFVLSVTGWGRHVIFT